MRYRLHISRAELFAAAFPFMDGMGRLIYHHADHAGGSVWHTFHTSIMPYILISPPILICLQYFYGYVELTPSSLEYQAVFSHRSIAYPQIERVVCKAQSLGWSGVESTEISGSGMKKMILKLEETKDFIHELEQYAPQARMEVPDIR